MRKFSYLVIMLLFGCSCKSQLKADDIINTTQKVIQSIKDSNYNNFRNLIAVDLAPIGKDEGMVIGDFKRCCYYYKLYSKLYKIKNIVDNDINELGWKKVSVIFFERQRFC